MNQLKSSWRRVVIKVGSALVAPEGKGCSTKYLLALADFIHHCHNQNKQVVIVSSGSVAAGAGLTNHDLSEPLSIPQKQALAAIGQSHVMQHWQKLFDDTCAQILLTRSDLEGDKRVVNARNTLETLFKMDAIPIINENDSVVVDELVVGDNDNLAARVAVMCDADLLLICSDVNGLYDKNPKQFDDAKLLATVDTIDERILGFADVTNNPIATGGMHTKLQAAQLATGAGIDTIIINGREAKSFERLKNETISGTLFIGR
ncbi:glutamate 5-kinase [Aliikangiella coralliicola]|uniref:Glutamate 5-kinase n=1 Tax=Aliikangiella coralliicola TaxID=2592383 RepID=A0A545UAJ4_9GAMM|nr:glutamate 5-kinase [Aliikangiella coralliicola]TQV86487.1 glutamate 5-kinase [Aliikangiella coralliicola]